MTNEAEYLAGRLIDQLQIPAKATNDAFHISLAAVHGIQYLLTWNCKHIANPEFRSTIDGVCREASFEPPIICTPFEMLEIGYA